ncbi:MAG: hypothetical protein KA140_07085 [Caldisericia bacterium]|nr:hypothetical protein [Caldisericia bacterium]
MKKLVLAVAAICLVSMVPAIRALDVAPARPQAAILDIFDYINNFRVENGLPKLIWNDDIADITEEHSRKMHDSSELNHFIQGKGPEDRLNDAGIKWSCYVENVAYNKGQSDKAKAAFESWKKSDGHRKNMLDSCVTEGAIGYTGCEVMGHYFTFMAFKPASEYVVRQEPFKVAIKVGSVVTAKVSIKNPGDSAMTIKAEVTLKPSGVRFGVGPAEASIEPGKAADFSVTIGAETSKAGQYNGEITFAYNGGKLIHPFEINVEEQKESTAILWIGKNEYYVNDVKKTTSSPPMIYKNSTVVGLRMISDIFGAKVDYYAPTKTITINHKGIIMIVQVGNSTATINGVKVTVKPEPMIIKGSTYVPFRFIVENLGGRVNFNATEKKITIIF